MCVVYLSGENGEGNSSAQDEGSGVQEHQWDVGSGPRVKCRMRRGSS